MLHRLVQASRGAEHEVVSLTDLGAVAPRIQKLGVRTRALHMSRVPNPSPIVRLARLVRDARPDVVQTWMYHADVVGGLAAMLAGHPKVVWGIHNSTLDRTSHRMTRWIVSASARLSHWLPDRIVSVSRSARDLHVGMGYDAARFTVIPNGIDPSEYRRVAAWRREVRAELGVPDSRVLVGVVARVHPQKDHGNFIRAAAALSRRRPDVSFVLCGDGTADDPEIAAAIDREGVRARFLLLGRRTDVPRVMNALDVLSLSSAFGEAFPLVVAEAMACEVPCVVTDLGDCAYLVADTGRVARPRDPAALARALEALVDLGEDGRRRMGAAARRRIETEFSLARVAEAYEAVYRSLLAGAAGPHVAAAPPQ